MVPNYLKLGLKLAFYIGIPALPILLTYLIESKIKSLIEQRRQQDRSKYDFIFVSYENHECKRHIFKRLKCSETCSYQYLTKIVQMIDTAKKSVSLCAYLLTCDDIGDALIRAKERNLNVRFITDKTMASCTGAKANDLARAGVAVREQSNAENIVHHKFCLVDEADPVNNQLCFGTLNLTLQGLTLNFDNLMFTNNPSMIARFAEEFEYMWNCFHELKIIPLDVQLNSSVNRRFREKNRSANIFSPFKQKSKRRASSPV